MSLAVEHREGVAWYQAPKPLSRIHRHRWQTRGFRDGLLYLERCSCGAASEGDGRWFFIGHDKPRVRFV